MQCDKCNKPAVHHLTEIQSGKHIVKHLCEQCAAQNDGLVPKAHAHAPINELLTNFVLAHSGLQKERTAACPHCAISWAEFRQGGMFGCEHDYIAFEKDLTPLLQRAHENGTHHIGKIPVRRGAGATEAGLPVKRQVDVAKLRKDLAKAVDAEDYERAARLRDQIKQAEGV